MSLLRHRDVSSEIVAVAIADETTLQAGRNICPFQITFKNITIVLPISIVIYKNTEADRSRAHATNVNRVDCMLAAVRAPLTLDTPASLGRCVCHGSTVHARQHDQSPQNERTGQINSDPSPQVRSKTYQSERLLVWILNRSSLMLGRGVWRIF